MCDQNNSTSFKIKLERLEVSTDSETSTTCPPLTEKFTNMTVAEKGDHSYPAEPGLSDVNIVVKTEPIMIVPLLAPSPQSLSVVPESKKTPLQSPLLPSKSNGDEISPSSVKSAKSDPNPSVVQSQYLDIPEVTPADKQDTSHVATTIKKEPAATDKSTVKSRQHTNFKLKTLKVEMIQKICRTYRCRLCSASVGSVQQLVAHLELQHKMKVKGSPRIVDASERDEKQDQENISRLLESIENQNHSELTSIANVNHKRNNASTEMDNETGTSEDQYPYILNNTPQSLTMKPQDKNYIRCEYCFQDFGSKHKYRFDDHMKWHTEDKMFNCTYCDMSFYFQFNLQKHLRALDTENSNDAPMEFHKCSACDSSFANRKCLLFHLTHHDGHHRCQICEKSFPRSNDLVVHTKNKHTKQSDRYSCTECGKLYNDSKSLTKHMKSDHYRIVCPFCQAAFTTAVGCNGHVKRMHTETVGVRPFPCTMCNQSFTAKAYLTRHYRHSHNIEPPGTPGSGSNGQIPHLVKPKNIPVAVKSENPTRRGRSNNVLQNYNEDSGSENEYLESMKYIRKSDQLKFIKQMKMEQEQSNVSSSSSDEESTGVNNISAVSNEIISSYDTQSVVCCVCSHVFANYWNRMRHERLTHKIQHKTTRRQQARGRTGLNKLNKKRKPMKQRRVSQPVPSSSSSSTDNSCSSELPSSSKIYPCPRCPQTFQSPWKVNRHVNSKNCNPGITPNTPNKIPVPLTSSSTDNSCSSKFPDDSTPNKIPEDIKTIKSDNFLDGKIPENTAQEMDKGSNNSSAEEGNSVRNVRKTRVRKCTSNFRARIIKRKEKTVTALPIIIKKAKLHGTLKIAKCPYCKKKLVSNQGLRYHLTNTHPELNHAVLKLPTFSFVCPRCTDRTYTSKQSLWRHVKQFHPEDVKIANKKRMENKLNKLINRKKSLQNCNSTTESSSESEQAIQKQLEYEELFTAVPITQISGTGEKSTSDIPSTTISSSNNQEEQKTTLPDKESSIQTYIAQLKDLSTCATVTSGPIPIFTVPPELSMETEKSIIIVKIEPPEHKPDISELHDQTPMDVTISQQQLAVAVTSPEFCSSVEIEGPMEIVTLKNEKDESAAVEEESGVTAEEEKSGVTAEVEERNVAEEEKSGVTAEVEGRDVAEEEKGGVTAEVEERDLSEEEGNFSVKIEMPLDGVNSEIVSNGQPSGQDNTIPEHAAMDMKVHLQRDDGSNVLQGSNGHFMTRRSSARSNVKTKKVVDKKVQSGISIRKRQNTYAKVLERAKRKITIPSRFLMTDFKQISTPVVKIQLKAIDQSTNPRSSPRQTEQTLSKNKKQSIVNKTQSIRLSVCKKNEVVAPKTTNISKQISGLKTIAQKNKRMGSVQTRKKTSTLSKGYANPYFPNKSQNHETLEKLQTKCLCPNCGAEFSSKSNTWRHMKTTCIRKATVVSYDYDKIIVNPISLSEPRKQNVYKCLDCGKYFLTVRGLQHHQVTVHRNKVDKPFPCSDCACSYKLAGSLLRHRQLHHGVERQEKR